MGEAEIRWVKPDLQQTPPLAQRTIAAYRDELDQMYTEMKTFDDFDLGNVFLKLAGWSARASEIRSHLSRHESRQNTAFKSKEIEPFLSEIDRQFRTFSRIQALRESEYKMDGKL